MTELLTRVLATALLLLGTYLGCWRGDYPRASYFTALACFAAIAAMTKEGGAK